MIGERQEQLKIKYRAIWSCLEHTSVYKADVLWYRFGLPIAIEMVYQEPAWTFKTLHLNGTRTFCHQALPRSPSQSITLSNANYQGTTLNFLPGLSRRKRSGTQVAQNTYASSEQDNSDPWTLKTLLTFGKLSAIFYLIIYILSSLCLLSLLLICLLSVFYLLSICLLSVFYMWLSFCHC